MKVKNKLTFSYENTYIESEVEKYILLVFYLMFQLKVIFK